jgi:putative transposase
MTTQNKAYKFRLYPTDEQAFFIRKTFGCVRFVYNKMLAERKETYESLKEDKEALKKVKHPTPAKYCFPKRSMDEGFRFRYTNL